MFEYITSGPVNRPLFFLSQLRRIKSLSDYFSRPLTIGQIIFNPSRASSWTEWYKELASALKPGYSLVETKKGIAIATSKRDILEIMAFINYQEPVTYEPSIQQARLKGYIQAFSREQTTIPEEQYQQATTYTNTPLFQSAKELAPDANILIAW